MSQSLEKPPAEGRQERVFLGVQSFLRVRAPLTGRDPPPPYEPVLPRQMPQPDPQYTALQQQVQELNQQFTQRQQAEQQQQEAKVLAVIQQFAADPANVHFDKLQDKILAILQSPQILGDISAMSEAQKLKAAGIIPFANGTATAWQNETLVSALLSSQFGKQLRIDPLEITKHFGWGGAEICDNQDAL